MFIGCMLLQIFFMPEVDTFWLLLIFFKGNVKKIRTEEPLIIVCFVNFQIIFDFLLSIYLLYSLENYIFHHFKVLLKNPYMSLFFLD
jgi:hypothetical protein